MEVLADGVGGDGGVVEHEVGDEFGASGGMVAGDHRVVDDVDVAAEHVFYLGRFDADTTDLHLAVAATEVLQFTRRRPTARSPVRNIAAPSMRVKRS